MATDKSPGRRRLAVIGGVVGGLLIVGALLSNVTRSGSHDDPSPNGPPPATFPAAPPGAAGPMAQASGMAAKFAADEQGAAAAGIAYATASQRWLYFTDEEIRDALTQIATPAAAGRLADDVVREVAEARGPLGSASGRVWWLVRPMAWQVDSHTAQRSQVSVWVVTILAATGVAVPQTEWMTVTVDLAWADDDWRVDAVSETPGPTPVTGPNDQPWNAQDFDDALAGFTRMDGEPVR